MSRTLGLLILAALSQAGCMKQAGVRECGPPAVAPEAVVVERKVYVGIPKALTVEPAIAEGPLSQCPSVAAARRQALQTCAANLREIRAIEGTAVKP